MTSKLTRERLQELAAGQSGFNLRTATYEETQELARMALAAMDSEPVAWVSSESLDSRLAGIEAVTIPFVPGMDIPLFRRPVVTHNGDCDTDPFGFARRSGGLVVIDVNGDPHIKDGMPLYRHAQPAPVVLDSYVMVPMRLTAENGAKGALSGEFSETKLVNCPECFGDDECETCDGSGRIEITVPVTWTTIKEIWAKGVEHFAAAPQEVKQ